MFNFNKFNKMHSAVELNRKILEKSKDASLVLINIPAPPKHQGIEDNNCTLNLNILKFKFNFSI